MDRWQMAATGERPLPFRVVWLFTFLLTMQPNSYAPFRLPSSEHQTLVTLSGIFPSHFRMNSDRPVFLILLVILENRSEIVVFYRTENRQPQSCLHRLVKL